jgi:hypothetical protein
MEDKVIMESSIREQYRLACLELLSCVLKFIFSGVEIAYGLNPYYITQVTTLEPGQRSCQPMPRLSGPACEASLLLHVR